MNKTNQAVKKELDFDANYRVEGYRGIAWYLHGYKTEEVPTICYGIDENGDEYEMEDWSETEKVEDRSQVVATMVGDNRKFTFDVDEVTLLGDDEFCHTCGQIGCCH
jgi:hypothetical protein